MPTRTLTAVELQRQAFNALLSAIKALTPELLTIIRDGFAADAVSAAVQKRAWDRLRVVPRFDDFVHLTAFRWREEPTLARDLTLPDDDIRPMFPVPVVGPVRLDRANVAGPLLAFPERETEEDFVAWARAHYQERARAANVVPVAPRRELRRQAEWYLRREIQEWTLNQTADDDASRYTEPAYPGDISKGVKTFAELLGLSIQRQSGRPRSIR